MKDSFEKLQSLFAEALVDAGNNYQANKGQKNTTSEGDVKFEDRPFEEQVDAVLSGKDTVSTHLRISEHTPQILLDLGLSDKTMLITSNIIKILFIQCFICLS